MKASPPTFFVLSLLLFFLFFSLTSAATTCHPSDQKALLHIKNTFIDTKDYAFTDWDPKTTPDCCKWSGVLTCNTNGRVTWLRVQPLYFLDAREIPPAIGDLSFLEQLEFYGNVTGPIPDSIGNLVNLQNLQLGDGLTGPIPESLGRLKKLIQLSLASNSLTAFPSTMDQLTSLRDLYIDHNKLSGPIPDSLSRLRKLEVLYLANNRLSGPIPASLSRLPKLAWLDLSANKLTGTIPASFGSFKSPRLWLTLSENRLSGPVPKSLGQAHIERLELNMNQLTGDASFLLGKNKTALEIINLSHNYFKFDFSNVDLAPGIRNLDINHNEIYGSLPKRLSQLPLQAINVSYNSLCGMIPTGRRLKRFSPDSFAHNKCLCGPPLPPCK